MRPEIPVGMLSYPPTLICPNTLANIDPKGDLETIADTVRIIFGGSSPPNNSISLITTVGQITANAFIQGVPIVLYDKEVHRRWFGMISVLVIHPSTAAVIRHYRHATHRPVSELKAFIESLQPGRILLIAGSARFIGDDLKEYLTSLGVNLPAHSFPAITPNSSPLTLMASWVGIVGGNTIGDATRVWQPLVQQGFYQEFYVPKSEDVGWCGSDVVADWSTGLAWEARQELCQIYDGYGNFCACPPLPPPTISQLKGKRGTVMSKTVAVVMASRPTALHRLLVSLIQSGGIRENNILVFTNQPSAPELNLVCKSHGVSLEWSGRASDCDALHKTRLYESAIRTSLVLRPKTQFFITLEDDMEVEPDLFRWLSKARQILRYDDRFICINTITTTPTENAVNSNRNSTNNEGETFLPGWAVHRPVLEAMLQFWPVATHDLNWMALLDFWAGDTPCLAPPRSYVKHMAASFYSLGADLSPAMPQKSEYSKQILKQYVIKAK